MASTTKRKWLEEGLNVLAASGAAALTIETLTNRLGVTKGSFYHHFQHFRDYKEHLLTFYEDERTLQVIKSAERREAPLDRLELIIQGTLHEVSQLEVSMRAWALQDLMVRSFQQRIDQRRLAYLAELAFQLCHDRERAQRIAHMLYSIFVGSQHILPPVQGEELEALYREVERSSDFLSGTGEVKHNGKEA
ncbi:TetR family transcriptional regulator [Dictyobacter alpinus]|uniref:TetR family transcriptional regulator n=1 Tax=Dictyobacter alpinus TaxID=2014873 RepID=A0A402BF96_9CHLR|nr:TetR/AcrR family transcriptional regulator [Dictyobacter alpinus]GCE29952.1 TetR family transcriptional regulator [Dictyobacter alpinus]